MEFFSFHGVACNSALWLPRECVYVNACACMCVRVRLYSLLGSRGPSTVTFMARWYVATCGGLVNTVIVNVKLLPVVTSKKSKSDTNRTDNDLHSSQISASHMSGCDL